MVNIKRHPEIEVETPNENGDIKNETLISKIEKHIEENIKFFSLEFFPPRTPNGAINLVARFDRMSRGGPLFCDVTWHPAGDPSGDKETSSTTIASIAANYCGIETMLHMTCANTTQETVIKNLQKAKKLGLRNILALRGDPPIGEEWKACCEHLKYGADMVRLVRKVFGKYFTICVAGYPQGHPDCTSYEDDLRYLKDKVDAGADFIITQLFFDIRHYFKFVKDCRQIGIHCPIIPGILPIQSYASLRQLVKLSKLEIPQTILDVIEPIKNNDEAIRNYGVSLAVDICKQLLNSQDVPGLHIYTLNREVATIDILKALGLWKRYHVHRPLPWRHSAHTKRIKEDVRPIFWATRPKSYVHRTSMWDEYPNGRWGNSAAPSFSELSDHHLFYLRSHRNDEDRKKMWGEKLESIQDVYHVFQCYLGNKENKWGHKVKSLPFNDDELHAETSLLVDELRFINGHGFLTINSQPNVDAVRSDDERFGWGGAGGYIYQKAYLEFFMHKDHLDTLLEVLTDYPQVNYHIIDNQGVYDETNADRYSPIAVTWGVFPGKEIAQPTVVDPISFNFWKDEAFSLWTQQWQTLYDKNSKSYSILQSINDNFYLVNLVDNDFIKGNCLFDILRSVIEKEKLSEQDEHDNIEATNLNDDNLTTSDTINIRETLNDLAAASLSTSPILTNSPAVPS